MMSFRLSVIGLSLDNPVSTLALRESSSLSEVSAFFAANPPRHRYGRTFILERSGAYRPHPPDFEAQTIEKVLHDRLGVPDDFLDEHTTQGPAFTTDEDHIRSSWLPSSMPAEKRFHQDLFSMWLYTGCTQDVQWPCSVTGRMLCPGDEGLALRCEATGRELQFYQRKTLPEGLPLPEGRRWLMIVPHRCSYWSVRRGDSWDGRHHFNTIQLP